MTNAELVTTAQAAAILGRSRWALYRLMEAGSLRPAMKTPASTGTYLFDRAHVDDLARREAAARAATARAPGVDAAA